MKLQINAKHYALSDVDKFIYLFVFECGVGSRRFESRLIVLSIINCLIACVARF